MGKGRTTSGPGRERRTRRQERLVGKPSSSGGQRPPSRNRRDRRFSHPMPEFAANPQTSSQPDSEEDAALILFLGETLRQANRPLGMDELLRITKLPRRSKKHMEYVLFLMQERGLALKGSTGWFGPANLRYVEGVLSVQRGGMGFVTPRGKTGQDIFIAPTAMNGAWPGDLVKVLVLPGRRGPSPEGRIMVVLERADREIAATALKQQRDGAWMCAPADKRIQALFVTDTAGLEKETRENDLLLLRPGEQLGPNLWQAVATVNLEQEESPAAQERLVKSSRDIPSSFPESVRVRAGSFLPDPVESDFAGRKRLETHAFVTIDGRRARDFDDAIQVERQGEGYRLRVAIADVSHYVPAGSVLDAEARLRGNSYYFPLSVEPMLPEALSNGLCSLRPRVPRLVMVADMLFSGSGERTSADFYPAVIESKARLTYGQIERGLVLREPEELDALGPVLPMLEEAEALARLVMARRRKRGSLDFDLPEPEALFDEQGKLIALVPRRRHFGHRLIEEFMIAANEAVAEFLRETGEGTLYRVHQPPDPEKLVSLVRYLDRSGLAPASAARFSPRGKKARIPSAADLSALLDEVRGSPVEYSVNRLILRSMMQARYEPDNEGHFGLASACYCHFTSPIRRYADLVTHRALKHSLGIRVSAEAREDAGEGQFKPYTRARLMRIAEHVNECERTAAEAEREIFKRLGILLLKDRIGECFEGVVSGLAEFGIFVELPSVMAEGMVSLGSLTDDFYQYISETQEIRGTGTGKTFRLGQIVNVELVDVHLGRQEADLRFIKNTPKGK